MKQVGMEQTIENKEAQVCTYAHLYVYTIMYIKLVHCYEKACTIEKI